MSENTRSTSVEHFKTYDAKQWYDRILDLMREFPDNTFCIADVAKELNAEKSTISARMNELFSYGEIEYEGMQKSRATGIKSRHFKIRMQPTLI